MRVSCRIDVPGGEALPEALGRTAYRIVQEGLTNARKHAPGGGGRGDDRGHAASSSSSRWSAGARSGWPRARRRSRARARGTGLIGLAERVGLAGGRLEHGPDAGGDFVLRATLPWTP